MITVDKTYKMRLEPVTNIIDGKHIKRKHQRDIIYLLNIIRNMSLNFMATLSLFQGPFL